jgi:hypothetical protein
MARLRTIKLREDRFACAPGAAIIDADFTIVRAGKKSRRKRSWFLLLSLAVFALAFGGMAGVFAPTLLAQMFSAWALG